MPRKISVAGWPGCGFYKKASAVANALGALFPADYSAEIMELADRASYRAWLGADGSAGFRDALGPEAAGHESSPIVCIDGAYLGGADAMVAHGRQLLKPPSAAAAQAPQHVPDGQTVGGDYEYDLVVIGGGSGGLSCAKEAARLGARVACLDFVKPSPAGTAWGLGGTCVNVGCIPKKLMHTAGIIGEVVSHDAKEYGWEISGTPTHNWEEMRQNIQDHIRSLNFGYRVALREASVTYLNKLGSFVDAHTVECVDKKGKRSNITSARFVIAVGGRPTPLSCSGGELAISSDDLFSLEKAPGKTACIGAGYVSLECGGFLTALGLDTTIFARSILLRGFDRECCDKIEAHMIAGGTKIVKGVVPVSIEKIETGQLRLTLSDGSSDLFDTVLGAIGRTADTDGLNLAAAGVEVVPRNKKLACVNEQSNVPHIYAIGDVLEGKPELTPVAIEAGLRLARRLFSDSTETLDYRNIATTVFTPLEYGSVGLTEEQAIEELGACQTEVYHSTFSPLEHAPVEARKAKGDCFCKIIVNQTTDEVLAMHYLGPNAGEVTQAWGIAIRKDLKYSDVVSTVGIHPTAAEELVTLRVTKSSGESAAKTGC